MQSADRGEGTAVLRSAGPGLLRPVQYAVQPGGDLGGGLRRRSPAVYRPGLYPVLLRASVPGTLYLPEALGCAAEYPGLRSDRHGRQTGARSPVRCRHPDGDRRGILLFPYPCLRPFRYEADGQPGHVPVQLPVRRPVSVPAPQTLERRRSVQRKNPAVGRAVRSDPHGPRLCPVL